MTTFIDSTVGLQAQYGNHTPAIVRIEFNRIDENTVELQPISGRNLSKLKVGRTVIAQSEFENRTHDPYNDTKEAVWALERCGFNVCGVTETPAEH